MQIQNCDQNVMFTPTLDAENMGLWRPYFTNCSSMCLFGFMDSRGKFSRLKSNGSSRVCEMDFGSLRPWTCGFLEKKYTDTASLDVIYSADVYGAYFSPCLEHLATRWLMFSATYLIEEVRQRSWALLSARQFELFPSALISSRTFIAHVGDVSWTPGFYYCSSLIGQNLCTDKLLQLSAMLMSFTH